MRNVMPQWPRETRDTLFTLGVIVLTLAPLLANLPAATSLVCVILLAAKVRQVLLHQPTPGATLMGLLLVACALVAWFSHRTLLDRDAGVSIVVMMLTLKTLEIKGRRDSWVLFFLAFFTILTHFFFAQTMLSAGIMLIATWGWMTALVLAHRPVGKPPLASVAWTSAKLCLLGAPVMLALFVLFPRLPPLWGKSGEAAARTGLSGQLQIGKVAQLAQDSSIALRVRWLQAHPPAQSGTGPPGMPTRSNLYFRGPVFTVFDGQRWFAARSESTRENALGVSTSSPAWDYEVSLEPHRQNWLLALDGSTQPSLPTGTAAVLRHDMQWTLDRAVTDVLTYRARSYQQYHYVDASQHARPDQATELPAGVNPRTRQWAREIRSDPKYSLASSRELISLIQDHLRTGGYVYTLNPGTSGLHAADEFWFDRKQGFCEHIATSFVILMRELGVPARVVTGYQGGELNPVDGQWTVRQSDAHAWAEVWDSASGWVRVDPTSVVAPARIEQLQRLQAPAGPIEAALSGALGGAPAQWLVVWRSRLEAVNTRWNQYVVNYSQARQFEFLKNLGISSPSWEQLVQLMGGLTLAVCLVAMLAMRQVKRKTDPWLALLNRFRDKLGKLGLACTPSHTPREIAHLMQSRWGKQGDSGSQWLLSYESARYANKTSAKSLAQLQHAFSRIAWPNASA
ncbi:MAG: hypothetical protein RLZZ271_65 [Pseudomonadota bacterium]|jgi:transglutaminase-like putative cysteine protease